MDDQNKNLILATALSFLVILVWFVVFPPEEPVVDPNATAVGTSADGTALVPPTTGGATTPPTLATPADTRAAALADDERLKIDTPVLSGSISLTGGRIDDLSLTDYRETLEPDSPTVTLLSPVGSAGAYYTLYGWSPTGALSFEDVPGANTVWSVESGDTLSVSMDELTPDATASHSVSISDANDPPTVSLSCIWPGRN